MTLLVTALLSGLAIVLVLGLFSLFTIKVKAINSRLDILQSQLQADDVLINEMQSCAIQQQRTVSELQQLVNSQQTENEQVSKQLEHRIKSLQQQMQTQQVLYEQLQNQQPEDKLYSRALKLVALGADVAEIMRECDIPRAEAEMLMSVHQNKDR